MSELSTYEESRSRYLQERFGDSFSLHQERRLFFGDIYDAEVVLQSKNTVRNGFFQDRYT